MYYAIKYLFLQTREINIFDKHRYSTLYHILFYLITHVNWQGQDWQHVNWQGNKLRPPLSSHQEGVIQIHFSSLIRHNTSGSEHQPCHPRWLSGLRRSRVHSLWLLVDHCVLRNWYRILVRAVKGLISRAGMVSICPLLWQRDVKLQQTKHWAPTMTGNQFILT